MLSSPAKQKFKKKKKKKRCTNIPSNDELFIYIKLACVWVLLALWFSCYKLAQDIPEDVLGFFFFFFIP